ncbi:MAG: rod shape-determining protein [Clostridia bacterium]|nr:rod shape-determining protein [Clostridia bacterium]
MAVFSSGGVGFDLGSSNVTIYLENEGVVLREPSYILTSADNNLDILAVGREARQLMGRTPRDVSLTAPIVNGAVTDIDQTSAMIQAFGDRAIGRRRALEKTRIVVAMPQNLSRVELDALKAAVRDAGAKRAALVYSPIAAAVGGGISINEPRGIMEVVIGGGSTEIAVISMNGVVAARSVRTGANAFDQAIVRHIRREKGLIIGMRTAEDLKIDVGSAIESKMTENFEVLLRGRDAHTGKPATVSVTAADVRTALQRPIDDLIESIREAFENTPPELAADILERGIQLSGGGCQLDGLERRIGETIKLPVRMGEAPQDDVAAGAGMIASDDRLLHRFAQTGCVIEL